MLRPHTTHYFFLLLLASITLNSACSYCGKSAATPSEATPQPVPPIVSSLPFSTKEPALYQAEIVISFPAGDATTEQNYFTARDGEKRRIDYELSEKDTMSVLEVSGNKTIVLLPQKACATEDGGAGGSALPPQTESFTEFLTTGWLAEKIPAGFEALGKENVGGKQLTKFRVRFEKASGVESVSEALVWVDEEIGMPVRTELYSAGSGQQGNKTITEFRNLKLGVDSGVFDAPAGCQNISAAEMRKILQKKRLDAE